MAYPRPSAASAVILLLGLLGCHLSAATEPPTTSNHSSSGDFPDDILSLLQHTDAVTSQARSLLSKRAPHWRINVQGFSEGDMEQDERLVMNHLAKCGGSFIKHVLRKSIPKTILSVENEADSLTSADLGNESFVIGLVRNPFDYYVSLWAFASHPATCCFKHALTRDQLRETLGTASPLGSTALDRAHFKKWLFAINNQDLGTMSARFYGSYLWNWGSRHRLLPKRWHYLASTDGGMRLAAPDVNAVLGNFTSGQGPVDCWIQTEDLVAGLRNCLTIFEQGINASVVDWAALNRSVATSEQNGSPHAPCPEMYDNESLALVASADRHLIRAFGYANHCTSGVHSHSELRSDARRARVSDAAGPLVLALCAALLIW